jgi:H+/Cl- antiporter ClcA/CBS domain-containing protein
LLLLCLIAAVIGLAAGFVAWLLVKLIALLTNLTLFHTWSTKLPNFSTLSLGPNVVLVAMAGATIVTLLARWSPIIRGHGIPEAMEAVLTKRSRIAPRTAVAKPASAAIAIGTGGPFGAEGPIIVTGGAIGSLLGQIIHISASERKILLACGAAAGMAATFGTPLAAVVLAIELLLFEFSPRALIPLVVATSVAGGVHAWLFSNGPLFAVPAHGFTGLGQLPLFAALGLACGLLAVIITRGLFAIEGVFRRLPVGEAWHPIIGAAVWASLGLLVPRALGVGYDVIGDALAGKLAIATLATLALGKLVIWWIALASGTSGGTLAPILIISSCTGALVGQLLAQAAPGLGITGTAFALVAMAATFGAAAGAPFAAIVFIFELTRDYNSILPLMLATVLAALVARTLLPHTIMTEKLARRGVPVPASYHADPMRTTRVQTVMSPAVITLPVAGTMATLSTEVRASHHSAYPLVDGDGKPVSMVLAASLLDEFASETPLSEVAEPVVKVGPSDDLQTVLEHMGAEEVGQALVVEGGRLVGICTRSDILRARTNQLEHERTERGWLGHARRIQLAPTELASPEPAEPSPPTPSAESAPAEPSAHAPCAPSAPAEPSSPGPSAASAPAEPSSPAPSAAETPSVDQPAEAPTSPIGAPSKPVAPPASGPARGSKAPRRSSDRAATP